MIGGGTRLSRDGETVYHMTGVSCYAEYAVMSQNSLVRIDPSVPLNIAALMGCYYGMKSERGAQGVGRATKNSVEAAAVLILAANFILTGVFFSI